MKDKKRILANNCYAYDPTYSVVKLEVEALHNSMDEYAEEHTKAFINHLRSKSDLVDIPKSDALIDYWLANFKESLKK
jgi:hypothetical protein